MMRLLTIPIGTFLLWLMVFMTGCTLTRPVSDPTRFYILEALEPQPAAESREDATGFEGLAVGLRRVQLADYFNTPAIVVRTGENTLRYSNFNRWAEGLDRGTARILRESLRHHPAVASVLLFPEASREPVKYEVEVFLALCEAVEKPDGEGAFRFAADWKIYETERRAMVSRGEFTREGNWEPGDYAAFARSVSGACAELGRKIGREIGEMEE